MISPANLVPALLRFLEADQAITRDKLLAPKIRPLQREIAAVFREQGRLFLRGFEQFQGSIDTNAKAQEAGGNRVREAIDQSDWRPLWEDVSAATFDDFSGAIETAYLDALILGGGQLFETLGTDAGELGISWNLENPRAVAYANQHAAAQVSRIDDTTRAYLNSLISQATDEGWSYTKLSRAIGERFTEYATGGDNPRSRRIAVFELGDAYEAGNMQAAHQMEAAGLVLEKKWLTVGDGRVRPSHQDSQAEGWRPLDHVFASGGERSPTDSGCRCVMLYRRKR